MFPPSEFLLFYQIYIITVVVIGLAGNVLTILAICYYKTLRTPGNIFIASMSLSDSLYFIIVLPFKFLTVQYKAWIWGHFGCTMIAALAHLFIGASILHLAVIAFNRFVHVKLPSRYITAYKTKMVIFNIFLCYIIPFILCLSPVVNLWGSFSFESKTLQCSFTPNVDNAYRYTLVSIAMFVPSIFIIVCYSTIFYHVSKSRRRIKAWKRNPVETEPGQSNTVAEPSDKVQSKPEKLNKPEISTSSQNDYHQPAQTETSWNNSSNVNKIVQNSTKTNKSSKNDAFKLTIMMLFIFLVFLFSILPYFVVNIIDSKLNHPIAHIIAVMFTWINGCLNPIIYCAMNREFQKSFKQMFCRRWR